MTKFEKSYITGKFPYIVGVIIIVCVAVIYQAVKVMTVDKDKWMEYKNLIYTVNKLRFKDSLNLFHNA